MTTTYPPVSPRPASLPATMPATLYDLAAEGAVLGSMLMDRNAVTTARAILPEAEAFAKPEHRTLYGALLTLACESEGWDLVIVAAGLRRLQCFKATGGTDTLIKLAESVPTAANVAFYARIVADKYLARRWYLFGHNLAESAAIQSLPGVLAEMESEFRTLAGRARGLNTGDRLDMRPVSDYDSRAIDWLWPGRFPLGMLSLVAGIQGHGKSFLMCYMAAVVSRGLAWADGDNPHGPLEAAILSDEESVSYALRPRLEACGADLSRVFVLDSMTLADGSAGVFDIRSRLGLLEAFCETHPECRLVFFDSLAGFLGSTDPNDNAAVRQTLAPLTELAERRGIAIVGILHLNKKPDLSSVHRISGATAFTAVARAVWLVVREEDEAGKPARLLLPVKCNYADTAGLRYRIVNGAVVFDADAIVTDADSALANKKPKEEKDSAVDVACDWLRSQLENQPPKPAKDLLASAKAEGISEKTLQKARKQMDIQIERVGFGGKIVWML